jgi:predicted phage terminase large subunit-like protein
MNKWSIVYKKAILEDGSLLFPERLSHEFLEAARRTMGSFMWANQYMNIIIPEGEQTFKPEWIRYGSPNDLVDKNLLYFAFIDPAIGEMKHHDYTALVVAAVDEHKNWWIVEAKRQRINPTAIIEWAFEVHARYKCQAIGVEDVAFQRSIIHFAHEEAKRRGINLPVTGVKRGPDKTKQMRILSLVPRMEFGTLYFLGRFFDMELELAQFPRGAHDDLIDALSSLEEIVHYPVPTRRRNETLPANHPDYERQYRQRLFGRTRT